MNIDQAREAARKITAPLMFVDTAPAVVYHYTSVPALMGIIQSRSLWCSNVQFSNDPDESIYAHDLIEATLTATLPPDIAGLVSRTVRNFGYFAASFSAEKDLLQQWRAYCRNGRGVAIGIKSAVLRYHKRFLFGQIEYEPNRQRQLIQDIVKFFVSPLLGCELGSDEFAEVAGELAMYLAMLNGMFKASSYEIEREYRQFLAITKRAASSDKELLFRSTSAAIVPYFNVSLSESVDAAAAQPFGEIVIGPCLDAKTLTPALNLLLDREQLSGVAITTSNVHMRAE